MVLELDVDNKRLALGHKQLEENPWDTFETVFEQGSEHSCTIVQKTDKGAILELPYGIEGFCSNKNLVREDGADPKIGDKLPFIVVEFSKDDKRIILSHVRTYYTPEEKKSRKPRKQGGKGEDSGATLGDIAELSALKEQMKTDTKEALDKKEAAKKKAAEDKAKAEAEEAKVEEVKAEEKTEEKVEDTKVD